MLRRIVYLGFGISVLFIMIGLTSLYTPDIGLADQIEPSPRPTLTPPARPPITTPETPPEVTPEPTPPPEEPDHPTDPPESPPPRLLIQPTPEMVPLLPMSGATGENG